MLPLKGFLIYKKISKILYKARQGAIMWNFVNLTLKKCYFLRVYIMFLELLRKQLSTVEYVAKKK